MDTFEKFNDVETIFHAVNRNPWPAGASVEDFAGTGYVACSLRSTN
jgi:hypothetical protein